MMSGRPVYNICMCTSRANSFATAVKMPGACEAPKGRALNLATVPSGSRKATNLRCSVERISW